MGLRFIGFDASVSASSSVTIGSTTASASSTAELVVDTVLVTAHWVPLGGRRYARMGVLAGLGMTSYEFTETNDPGPDASVTTSGPATLLGVYLDWGADGIGGRFGAQYLATSLDPVNGADVDVSGREIYVDLRWAF